MGRHAASMGLYFLREDENRYHGAQDPVDGTTHEPAEEQRADVRGDVREISVRRGVRRDPGCAGTLCAGYFTFIWACWVNADLG